MCNLEGNFPNLSTLLAQHTAFTQPPYTCDPGTHPHAHSHPHHEQSKGRPSRPGCGWHGASLGNAPIGGRWRLRSFLLDGVCANQHNHPTRSTPTLSPCECRLARGPPWAVSASLAEDASHCHPRTHRQQGVPCNTAHPHWPGHHAFHCWGENSGFGGRMGGCSSAFQEDGTGLSGRHSGRELAVLCVRLTTGGNPRSSGCRDSQSPEVPGCTCPRPAKPRHHPGPQGGCLQWGLPSAHSSRTEVPEIRNWQGPI